MKSINDLLRTVGGSSKPTSAMPIVPEGTILNPEFPTVGGNSGAEAKSQASKIEGTNYRRDMNVLDSSRPRAGSYFSLGSKYTGDHWLDSFYLSGSIVPARIERQEDPLDAPPIDPDIAGAQGQEFQIPARSFTTTNRIGLVQQANTSAQNYKQRFLPQQNQNVNPISGIA
jgi:hypothetical protein